MSGVTKCKLCGLEFAHVKTSIVLLCKRCASHVKGVGISYVTMGDYILMSEEHYEIFIKNMRTKGMYESLMAEVVADRLEGEHDDRK